MLVLPPRCRDDVVAHARRAAPEECCGVLVGRREGGAARVETTIAAPNVARYRRRRYAIDPTILIDAHRRTREAGRAVVGYYHSHPAAPATPSDRDRTDAWAGVSYLIVSLAGDHDGADGVDLRSWRLAGDGFDEEPLLAAAETAP